MSLALLALTVFLPDGIAQDKKSSGKRIFDWEKAGDAEGWAGIQFEGAKKEFPFIRTVAQSDMNANTGKGSLEVSIESDISKYEAAGRAEKSFFGKPEDWSAFKKLTAKFYLTPGSPELEMQLAIQTGDNWQWKDGKAVDGKAGAWNEVSLDLSGVKNLDKVVSIYFIVRSKKAGFNEKVYLDNVELHESL